MRIVTTTSRHDQPSGAKRPFVLLRADGWDDFGFKTTYHATGHGVDGSQVDLGLVKIMRRGLQTSSTAIDLPTKRPFRLSDEYCSLGQKTSYYESLIEWAGDVEARNYLEAMRDLVLTPERYEAFADEPALQTSLLREGGARRAFEDAQQFLAGDDFSQGLSFGLTTHVGGEPFRVDFDFEPNEYIPSRINAVIGYNGVGKTRLMAHLAELAWRDIDTRREVASDFGTFDPIAIAFGRVVAISYSAFDTFDIPTNSDQYVYCGLRDTSDEAQGGRLKSPDEIARELQSGLTRLRTEDRWEALGAALAPLFREPSFQASGLALDFRDDTSEWLPIFEELSTGHKISLNIVVQLVSQLENKSLVLIDEPESHLHPPLLAALMRGIGEALDETNSYAIVATHSPVVLQEVSARHVNVLRRYGDITQIQQPPSETFGENVGILTRTVFDLDNAESDYEGILRSLGASIGVDAVSAAFPSGLSAQALAIVMEAEMEAELEDDRPSP